MNSLDQLPVGQRAIILSVGGAPGLVHRLMELGLLEGEQVEVLAVAPLGDPIEIRTGDSRLSLRRHDASGIQIRLLTPSPPDAGLSSP